MKNSDSDLQFHYKGVLNKPVAPGKPFLYTQHMAPPPDRPVDKPHGFRIPLIYFSWGLLAGDRSTHLHPDNDEILLVLSGQATIRLTGPGKPGNRFEAEYEVSSGDVVLFPQGWTHSVKDKGNEDDPVKVLVIFNNQDFKAVEVESSAAETTLGENA